jgi:acyl carrier protein
MESTNISSIIRHWLEQRLSTISTLPDDFDLIGGGFLTSTGALQMIVFLEDSFAIQIPDHQITLANFNSIENISNLVLRLKSQL